MSISKDGLTENRRTTVDTILAAAHLRYQQFGARKTTMGEVAKEAGLSRTTLYTYFATKEELYAAYLERETAAFVESVERQIQPIKGARHKLKQLVVATEQFYARNAILVSAITTDRDLSLETVARKAIEAHDERMVSLLSAVLKEGVEEGVFRPIDPDAVAYLIWQLGSTLILHEVTGNRRLPFETIIETLDDIISKGITSETVKKSSA